MLILFFVHSMLLCTLNQFKKMDLLFFFLFFFSSSFPKLIIGDTFAPNITKFITVDHKGGGDFTTISAAISVVPKNNNKWIKILVKSGVYREKVFITEDKRFILLEGEGSNITSVEWGDHVIRSSLNHSIKNTDADTATFRIFGTNIVVKYIAIKNTFNGGAKHRTQALAAMVTGDKIAFYHCLFYGIQDTLCDYRGRHYYKACYIIGAVDFIWGNAQTIYQGCVIESVGEYVTEGYITAHGRDNEIETSGFVFENCTITGTLKTYLGRPWRPFARVLFYGCFMENIIDPLGWHGLYSGANESSTFYAEIDCHGPGADKSKRVSWEKNLTVAQATPFVNISFIDNDGWIGRQP
ncbi:putative pectinesterase [Dioscorea sansibarensis]